MTLRSGVVRALIALVLLVGVVLVLPEFSKHLVPMPTAARTTSMEDVAITLEPERKDPSAAPPRIGIAKAYLTDPSAWHGGKQRRVTIETALPGLEDRFPFALVNPLPVVRDTELHDALARVGRDCHL